MRTFDPWIGSLYSTEGLGGVRLLILGESHYSRERERPTFTSEMIRTLGREGRNRFYSKVQRLVSGGRGWLSPDERADFWDRVAFSNFIQSFLAGPRIPPAPELWAVAKEPLLQTVAELNPHLLIALGNRLSVHLPPLPSALTVRAVQHPSSRGFRYDDWQPLVRTALNAVRRVPLGDIP